jgi:uncharacterized protein HemX
MIERFVTRVGKPGAIAILAAVIVAIGFGGAVVEHIRLAAATEQQGEQNSTQSASKNQDSNANQAGSSQQSQDDQASGARQQGDSTNDSAMSVQHQAAA